MQTISQPTLESLSRNFHHWEKTGDLIDQCIDLMLNLRQSGHPGGSRSKVPLLVASTLGAGMRWDVRRPEKAFGDRFVLIAGHCCPVVYAMLAVYNEALALRYEETGDERYLVPRAKERALRWDDDLLWLRHNGHLAGHAEMEGKTLFFKWNTGPSGHGAPAALERRWPSSTPARETSGSSQWKERAGTRPAAITRSRTRPSAWGSTT